jgi:hypothetical protein
LELASKDKVTAPLRTISAISSAIVEGDSELRAFNSPNDALPALLIRLKSEEFIG